MVEAFNHPQVSDNVAAKNNELSQSQNLAVGAWQDSEKMSLNKAVPNKDGGLKSLDFDDIYTKKESDPSLAEGMGKKFVHKPEYNGDIKKPLPEDVPGGKIPRDGGPKDPTESDAIRNKKEKWLMQNEKPFDEMPNGGKNPKGGSFNMDGHTNTGKPAPADLEDYKPTKKIQR